jgi:2-furoate---CoA ligase
MLDLGLSFIGSVARDPNALAIVDGELRLTYAQWYRRISALVAGLDALGLKAGDHLVTALQNRWEAATLHWACQFAGVIITPVNWRSSTAELDFFLRDAGAKALVYEDAAAAAATASQAAQHLPRIALDGVAPGVTAFAALTSSSNVSEARPRVDVEAWSVMLYTSGTTARPKGVPRRQRAERAAAVAHVAQNLYGHGERTLGVMPLYHTMGVRSLLAMSLIGGAFICLRRFEPAEALRLIAAERVTNLYLVPTLYHDLVHHSLFPQSDIASVRKLGFAGAPMTDGLLKKLQAAFRPDLLRQSRAQRAAPGSTRWCAWSNLAPKPWTSWPRPAKRVRSLRFLPATNPLTVIGNVRTPTPKRCARAGTSPAIPATLTVTATFSSPAASTT